MTDEKWQETIGRIKDDFEVFAHEKSKHDDPPVDVEMIVFKSPIGKVKLERMKRPIVLNKKAIGSKRIGGRTHVQYIYSDSEFSDVLKAYRFDEQRGEWMEIETKTFFS